MTTTLSPTERARLVSAQLIPQAINREKQATEAVHQARADTAEAIALCRVAGVPWVDICLPLGRMTRMAGHNRWKTNSRLLPTSADPDTSLSRLRAAWASERRVHIHQRHTTNEVAASISLARQMNVPWAQILKLLGGVNRSTALSRLEWWADRSDTKASDSETLWDGSHRLWPTLPSGAARQVPAVATPGGGVLPWITHAQARQLPNQVQVWLAEPAVIEAVATAIRLVATTVRVPRLLDFEDTPGHVGHNPEVQPATSVLGAVATAVREAGGDVAAAFRDLASHTPGASVDDVVGVVAPATHRVLNQIREVRD